MDEHIVVVALHKIGKVTVIIYIVTLVECMALWGEPNVVIGCICATQ